MSTVRCRGTRLAYAGILVLMWTLVIPVSRAAGPYDDSWEEQGGGGGSDGSATTGPPESPESSPDVVTPQGADQEEPVAADEGSQPAGSPESVTKVESPPEVTTPPTPDANGTERKVEQPKGPSESPESSPDVVTPQGADQEEPVAADEGSQPAGTPESVTKVESPPEVTTPPTPDANGTEPKVEQPKGPPPRPDAGRRLSRKEKEDQLKQLEKKYDLTPRKDEGQPIKFGQKGVSPTFSKNGRFNGKSIDEVVKELKAGTLSPDDLPVQYIWVNGEKVVINNRSLTTLSKAGLKPTVTVDMTGRLKRTDGPDNLFGVLNRLEEMEGKPSDTIPIRSTGDWDSPPKEIVSLAK